MRPRAASSGTTRAEGPACRAARSPEAPSTGAPATATSASERRTTSCTPSRSPGPDLVGARDRLRQRSRAPALHVPSACSAYACLSNVVVPPHVRFDGELARVRRATGVRCRAEVAQHAEGCEEAADRGDRAEVEDGEL